MCIMCIIVLFDLFLLFVFSRAGKYYYEVVINSNALFQVGWITGLSSPHCLMGSGYGVGDDEYSWSYDGHRQMKWGLSREKRLDSPTKVLRRMGEDDAFYRFLQSPPRQNTFIRRPAPLLPHQQLMYRHERPIGLQLESLQFRRILQKRISDERRRAEDAFFPSRADEIVEPNGEREESRSQNENSLTIDKGGRQELDAEAEPANRTDDQPADQEEEREDLNEALPKRDATTPPIAIESTDNESYARRPLRIIPYPLDIQPPHLRGDRPHHAAPHPLSAQRRLPFASLPVDADPVVRNPRGKPSFVRPSPIFEDDEPGQRYGEKWREGSVVGCLLDADQGTQFIFL
jgi:hypothetical protein